MQDLNPFIFNHQGSIVCLCWCFMMVRVTINLNYQHDATLHNHEVWLDTSVLLTTPNENR